MSDQHHQPRIGLALSGGAARGYAHIGVLEVMERAGISFSCIAGTSVGSIVGALLAAGFDTQRMKQIAGDLKWQRLVSPTLSGRGLVSARKLELFMSELLGDVTFTDLRIPFRAVATDLARAEEVIFSEGAVAAAVRASCSVPGIFEPIIDEDRAQALVDGGVLNNLPSQLVREMGADVVVAVDLNSQRPDTEIPVNLLDVTFRSFALLLDRTSEEGRAGADLVIRPDLNRFSYHELSHADEMIRRGAEAAEAQLETIRAIISGRRGAPAANR